MNAKSWSESTKSEWTRFIGKKIGDEKKKLLTELDGMHKKSEQLQNVIREYEIQKDLLERQREDQKKQFEEKETIDKIKYDDLERVYMELQKKIYTYQMKQEKRDNEITRVQGFVNENNKKKQQLELWGVK